MSDGRASHGSNQEPHPRFEIVRLKNSFDSFGVLVDFLSRREPFSRFDLGNFSRALQHQLAEGFHAAAISGSRLVGYSGWLLTTDAIAAAWIAGKGPLAPAKDGEAAVLTVIASDDPRIVAALIRRTRALNPGRRFHFRRDYAGGKRPTRKSSVRNIRGDTLPA